MTAHFIAAAKELEEGQTAPKPWEVAMAARRRDVVRSLTESAVCLRQEGDTAFADEVEQFIHDMPAVDSERAEMPRELLKQLQDRVRRRVQNPEQGRDEC